MPDILAPPKKVGLIDRLSGLITWEWDKWVESVYRCFGYPPNYTTFERDGTMVFNGGARVWRDENIAGAELGIGASPPDLIAFNGGTIYVRAFDGNVTAEQLFGGAEYQHDGYEDDSMVIIFHIHWCPTTNNAGNVKWQLAYQWIDEDTTPVAETIISVTQAANGTAWRSQKAAFPQISGAGKTIGSQLGFRLFRNPADVEDTYPNDAAISFTFGYHYEVDTVGSREMLSK